MIDKIEKGIREMITGKYNIEPNTIRLHPADVEKLVNYCKIYTAFPRCITILGLQIIETMRVKEGTAELYNDEMFSEVDLK